MKFEFKEDPKERDLNKKLSIFCKLYFRTFIFLMGLTVILGPMFAGKTTELIKEMKRLENAGYKTLLIKPKIDNRYSSTDVITHTGFGIECKVSDTNFESLSEIINENDFDVLGIDEFQFFENNPRLIEFIKKLSIEKEVFLAALNLDFRGKPWEIVKEILPFATDIRVLSAICTYEENGKICGAPAFRTQRLIDGKPAKEEDPTIVVGGKELYAPRCLKHFELERRKL